jgi:hypothetical protein
VGNNLVPDYGSGHFSVERTDKPRIDAAITALLGAIKEEEKQEPVAWIGISGSSDPSIKGGEYRKLFWQKSSAKNSWAHTWQPLYTDSQPDTPEGYQPIDEKA